MSTKYALIIIGFVLFVHLLNGQNSDIDSTQYSFPVDSLVYEIGKDDAKEFLRDGEWRWTAIGCGLLFPIGVGISIGMFTTPPQNVFSLESNDNRCYLNKNCDKVEEAFRNDSYLKGYLKGAHTKKKVGVASGFGIGVLISAFILSAFI